MAKLLVKLEYGAALVALILALLNISSNGAMGLGFLGVSLGLLANYRMDRAEARHDEAEGRPHQVHRPGEEDR